MPPIRTGHKRPAANTGRYLVKRTVRSRTALSGVDNFRHIDYMNEFEEENDDAPSDGVDPDEDSPEAIVRHLVAAAQAGLLGENAQEIALEFGDENVAPGAAPVAAAANVNSNDNSGAASAGAAASKKAVKAVKDHADAIVEVENVEDIEYVPDEQLAVAAYWKIKLLSQPKTGATLKAKEEWKEALVHKSPFNDSLDCHFIVEDEKWYAMKVFKHIIKDDVRFRIGDFVGIRPNCGETKNWGKIQIPNNDEKKRVLTPKNDWVARIIQLRAQGPSKVFGLVAWMYWPQHLITAWSKGESKAKDGRKGYHGDYELIASNHLDIIDVHSFDKNFNHLIEQDYEDLSRDVELTELYWRQTYDYRTGKLSELKRYCKCNKYNKPDQPLIQCTNSAHCGIWLHKACVIDDILSKKWTELRASDHRLKSKKASDVKKNPPNDINSAHINDARYKQFLSGKILADVNQVEVTDLYNDRVYNVPIECLKCGCTFT